MKKQKIIMLLLVLAMSYSNYCYANNFQWTKNKLSGEIASDYVSFSGYIYKNANLLSCVENGRNGLNLFVSEDNGYNWNKIYGLTNDFKYSDEQYLFVKKYGSTVSNNSNEIIDIVGKFIDENINGNKIFQYYFCVIDITNYTYFDTIPIDTAMAKIIDDFDFANRNAGIISLKEKWGEYRILKTEDGMQTWNEIFHTDNSEITDISMTENNISFIRYEHPTALISTPYYYFYNTTDGGETWNVVELWTLINKEYSNISFSDYKFCSNDCGFLLGRYEYDSKIYNLLLKTIDGGNTWNKILDTVLFDNLYDMLLNIEVLNENVICAYTSKLAMFTFDNGQNWEAMKYIKDSVVFSNVIILNENNIITVDHKTLYMGERISSIHEENILTSSMLYPNPTSDQTTITLSLQQASQIRISLNDIFGRELQLIHDAFADACEFTKSFTTQGLPKGVYYLKIQIDGNTKIEKVVVN